MIQSPHPFFSVAANIPAGGFDHAAPRRALSCYPSRQEIR